MKLGVALSWYHVIAFRRRLDTAGQHRVGDPVDDRLTDRLWLDTMGLDREHLRRTLVRRNL